MDFDERREFFLDVVRAIKCKFPERDNSSVIVEAHELWDMMQDSIGAEQETDGKDESSN